jgi:tetratricopeptide (TPR) repeat protein
MRNRLIFVFMFLLLQPMLWPGTVAAQSAEELMRSAKLAIFDQNWQDALATLRRVQSEHPRSPLALQSQFYEARVLENLGNEEQAIRTYEEFIEESPQNSTLTREARSSIVKLSTRLYRAGNIRYIDRTIEALDSTDQELRFLAAVQLSYIRDPAVNRKAVPILQTARNRRGSAEVENQATLALLRIDPKLLETGEKPAPPDKGRRTLSVAILVDGEETFKLSFPLSLARMLFSALPDDAKEDLNEEGLNPENILQQLESGNEIIEVRTSDGEVFRLWIE